MSVAIESKVDLRLTPNGIGCDLIIDGVDVSRRAYKVEVCAEAGKPTSVVVHFHLLDVTALGDTWVQYVMSPRQAAVSGYEALSSEEVSA